MLAVFVLRGEQRVHIYGRKLNIVLSRTCWCAAFQRISLYK